MNHRTHVIRLLSATAILLGGFCCNSPSTTGPGSGGGSRKSSFQATQQGIVELHGFIESIGNRKLTVFSHNVTVSDTTAIFGDGDSPLRFSDLLVGMWTEIHGTTNDGIDVLATRIDVEVEVEVEDSDASPPPSSD